MDSRHREIGIARIYLPPHAALRFTFLSALGAGMITIVFFLTLAR